MTHHLLEYNLIRTENFIMLTKIIYLNLFSTTLFPVIHSTIKTNSSLINNGCSSNESPSSIHSASIDEIYNIPMKDISRPLPSTLDENKVQSLMETIQVNINIFYNRSMSFFRQ
jgi:hypothetical protein